MFQVDELGRVHDVSVIESSGPEFGSAVSQALTQWTFHPQTGGMFKLVFHFVPTSGMSGDINWK
jgi:TonB family protein